MSELTIQAFGPIQPPYPSIPDDANVELRWWYNRSFLDSDGTQVEGGDGQNGPYLAIPCQVASGLVTLLQDITIWTTDDAQDPSPGSIFASAQLYWDGSPVNGLWQIAQKTQWVVPAILTPLTTWTQFSNFNNANNAIGFISNLFYYFTATQTIIQIREMLATQYFASDTQLGGVFLSVPADIPTSPVVWGENDPLVRDAVKLRGVAISGTTPSDTQFLVFNAATNQWEPANAGFGSGNVVSNEVVSVDGQVALFSGTGGKDIKEARSGVPVATLTADAITLTATQTTIEGQIGTDQTSSASVDPTGITAKCPLYNAAGTLVGYIPLYPSIT